MSDDKQATIKAELEMLEKLHRLGDDEGARRIARRLLISQTLDEAQKSRIERVINADKIRFWNIVIVVFAIILFIYFYLQYTQ